MSDIDRGATLCTSDSALYLLPYGCILSRCSSNSSADKICHKCDNIVVTCGVTEALHGLRRQTSREFANVQPEQCSQIYRHVRAVVGAVEQHRVIDILTLLVYVQITASTESPGEGVTRLCVRVCCKPDLVILLLHLQVYLTLTGMLLVSAVGVSTAQIFSLGTWVPIIGFIACMFLLISTPSQPALLKRRQVSAAYIYPDFMSTALLHFYGSVRHNTTSMRAAWAIVSMHLVHHISLLSIQR